MCQVRTFAVTSNTFLQASVPWVSSPPHLAPTLPSSSSPPPGKRALGLVTPELAQAACEANSQWLEDCLVMLLCVLALDRFGDYGSDQVTAPVRGRGGGREEGTMALVRSRRRKGYNQLQ